MVIRDYYRAFKEAIALYLLTQYLNSHIHHSTLKPNTDMVEELAKEGLYFEGIRMPGDLKLPKKTN